MGPHPCKVQGLRSRVQTQGLGVKRAGFKLDGQESGLRLGVQGVVLSSRVEGLHWFVFLSLCF